MSNKEANIFEIEIGGRKVTFETGGIDHSASNGSKAVSERVAREIYNYEPPVYIPYNFISTSKEL